MFKEQYLFTIACDKKGNFLRIKILALSLFFFFLISSLTTASAESIIYNFNNAKKKTVVEIRKDITSDVEQNPKNIKEFEVALNEGLFVNSNDNSRQKIVKNDFIKNISPNIHTKINLSEGLTLTTNSYDHDLILVLKQNSDNKAIMERIRNADGVRMTGKSVIIDSFIWNEQTLWQRIFRSEFYDGQFLQQLSSTKNLMDKVKRTFNEILYLHYFVDDISKTVNDNIGIFFEHSSTIISDPRSITHATDTKNNPTGIGSFSQKME